MPKRGHTTSLGHYLTVAPIVPCCPCAFRPSLSKQVDIIFKKASDKNGMEKEKELTKCPRDVAQRLLGNSPAVSSSFVASKYSSVHES